MKISLNELRKKIFSELNEAPLAGVMDPVRYYATDEYEFSEKRKPEESAAVDKFSKSKHYYNTAVKVFRFTDIDVLHIASNC